MSPPGRHRLAEIVDVALALSGAERAAYLDNVCAADPALRLEVGSLLAHENHAADNDEQRTEDAAENEEQGQPRNAG